MQTVLATFDDAKTAQSAVDQLVAQGFDRTSVHLQSATTAAPAAAEDSNSMMASVGHFFNHLFGTNESAHAGNYSEAVRRGSTVVAVDASDDAEVDKAQTLMQQLGSVNVDDRAMHWKSKGWTGFDPKSPLMTDDELAFERDSVPVVQEDLAIGKRTIDVGGLRVVKRMSETPVSEIVNLRREKATVARNAVDRPATEADFQNFKEGTFEVRETAEEAVVTKNARVIEEVSIGRKVTDQAETVSDTVRRTAVDVERVPGNAAAAAPVIKPPRTS